MPKTIISTPNAASPAGAYSQAVRAGALVFVSGQIALDPQSGQLVGGGIEAETRQVLDNLEAVLTSAGATLSDVVKVTVYLADMADFSAFNAIYAARFQGEYPARATVAVAGLPRGVRIELDAVAMTSSVAE